MSRTYRRRKSNKDWWIFEELIALEGSVHIWVPRDRSTEEFKKDLAIYHSDAGTTNFKEPGPSWFRNLYSERPARRKAKNELKKFMRNPEYEPMILAMEPLPYWT